VLVSCYSGDLRPDIIVNQIKSLDSLIGFLSFDDDQIYSPEPVLMLICIFGERGRFLRRIFYRCEVWVDDIHDDVSPSPSKDEESG
jgi:hypothetical protein